MPERFHYRRSNLKKIMIPYFWRVGLNIVAHTKLLGVNRQYSQIERQVLEIGIGIEIDVAISSNSRRVS